MDIDLTSENIGWNQVSCPWNEVKIIGVDGGGCVSLTALGACTAGYRVRLNTAAIGTMFTAKRDKYYAKLKALGAEIVGA